jgi:hypothetical protein
MSKSRTSAAPLGPRNFSKSRNGCIKCRAQRVSFFLNVLVGKANALKQKKCDEAHPSCNNCLSRGIACPGYQKSLKWSTKYETVKKTTESQVSKEQLPLPWPKTSKLLAYQPGDTDRQATTILPRNTDRTPSSPDPTVTAEIEVPAVSLLSPDAEAVYTLGVEDEGQDSLFTLSDPLEYATESQEDLPEDQGYEFQSDMSYGAGSRMVTSRQGTGSRGLLRNFYKILPTTLPKTLNHEGSMLVEHYFKDVCGIYSSYDSTLNPFRMSVAGSWSSTASIYYAIQSMAAAHLSNTYPSMEPVGIKMTGLANAALREELILYQSGQKNSNCALLVTLLLGLSACWHKTNDLGLGYLRVARLLMYPRLAQTESRAPDIERQDQFFEEALIYWEMMMAFVTPDDHDPLSVRPADEQDKAKETENATNPESPDTLSDSQTILPHPWTGVAPKVQMLFAEAAQLVRQERTTLRDDGSLEWATDSVRRRSAALSLEEQLLAVELPTASALVDSGDKTTSKQDFIIIAEATRCAALLEIYRVFPNTLQKRLGVAAQDVWSSSFNFGDDWFAEPSKTADDSTEFLNSLALHILDLIAKLPPESGTRFLQLMLIVVAASELRYTNSGINLDFLDLTSESLKIMNARLFAEERLGNHAVRLPAKPVRLMIALVREVWRRWDLGEEVFWLDIMIANKWETVMG